MAVPADDDVVMYRYPERPGDVDDGFVIWISACDGEGSYFGDKTLRMDDVSGATLDIIEPLALLAPTAN